MSQFQFFATAALGLEPLLAAELSQLQVHEIHAERAGVRFRGDLQSAYRVCLWSRLASRILLPLRSFPAADGEALYQGAAAIDWGEHLASNGTVAVDCALTRSQLRHSQYAALRIKDALVDQFRERTGERPTVARERPDLRLNLYIHRDRATLSIDLSGESLHRRSYRAAAGQAPLKENLAAALLVRAGWPELAGEGTALVDPFCGSGTLPVEAALIAADLAPGLLRDYFGFIGWRGHDPQLWNKECEAARQRGRQGRSRSLPTIIGYDRDPRAISAARDHAAQAGVDKLVHFERRALERFSIPSGIDRGLLATNPPYGERLGDVQSLRPLYNRLGQLLTEQCRGWRAVVLTGDPQLGRAIGLRAGKINTLYNGALKCQLLQFELNSRNRWCSLEEGAGGAIRKPLSAGATMFANRLRKNLKNFRKQASREGTDCFRAYDADLPEYAVAVDLYGDEAHLQEYRAPKTVDPGKAARRLQEIQEALPQVLDIPAERIHLKVRQRQKGLRQYEKQARRGVFKEVREGNCRFLVNLTDYLDTGLFLDHRPTRQLVQNMAAGKRFLNLFAYTGTTTVHALKGGASATTTVDMSRPYLEWAEKNLRLNGFDPDAQELIQADCLVWLADAAGKYDLIFLDPPSFSNSKGMAGTLDVQRDHVALVRKALRFLAPDGTLIFSNNLRTFALDQDALGDLEIENITDQTIPFDFQRNPRIHHCWSIRRP